MVYRIVLNRPVNLGEVTQNASDGLNPRHSMAELALVLDAKVHDGAGVHPSRADRAIATVTRTAPLWWAIARSVRAASSPGDVIFCTGEDVGLPVALLCGGRRRAHVVVMAHSVGSLRKQLALRAFMAKRRVASFTTVCERQAEFLRRFMGGSAERVSFLWDQTDTSFFSPGPPSSRKGRPLIVSVGLERRDYATLADATADLDVDVKISGYSADTRVLSAAFPRGIPGNMDRRFYTWPDLVQLYRDADVVVVPLFPNDYAAGVQGLMEGLSCGRPVIVTATAGLKEYLDPGESMRVVEPGDARGMHEAIEQIMRNSTEAKAMSSNGRVLAQTRHSCDGYVTALASKLVAMRT